MGAVDGDNYDSQNHILGNVTWLVFCCIYFTKRNGVHPMKEIVYKVLLIVGIILAALPGWMYVFIMVLIGFGVGLALLV